MEGGKSKVQQCTKLEPPFKLSLFLDIYYMPA